MSRPRGIRNAKPSRKAVANYFRLLQDKADAGDTTAAGWLCQLDLLDRQEHAARCSHQAEISRDGV